MVDDAFVASVVIGIKGGLLISSISEERVYAYFS
mgnify:CR=1 FL=1